MRKEIFSLMLEHAWSLEIMQVNSAEAGKKNRKSAAKQFIPVTDVLFLFNKYFWALLPGE